MNPYKNRSLPVGELEYQLDNEYDIWSKAQLEFGEKEFLFDIPRIVKGGILINLGDSRGGSAIILAQGIKRSGYKGTVITVDNYKPRLKKISEQNRKEAGIGDLITLINKTTNEAYESLRYYDSNFVFIDADHKFNNVMNDWLNYSSLIQEGGIVAFHDTNQEDIDKVLKRFVYSDPSWNQVFWVNRIKAFKKIK